MVLTLKCQDNIDSYHFCDLSILFKHMFKCLVTLTVPIIRGSDGKGPPPDNFFFFLLFDSTSQTRCVMCSSRYKNNRNIEIIIIHVVILIILVA